MAKRKRRKRRKSKVTQALTLSQAALRFDRMQENESALTPLSAYNQSAWVYGSVNLIASAIGNTPFIVEDRNGNIIEDGKLQSLIKRPSRWSQQDTDTKFRIAYFVNLLLTGSVLRVFTEIEGFIPKQMYAMSRTNFSGFDDIDEFGIRHVLWWKARRGAAKTVLIEGDEIHHDALFNPFHDWEGLSPLNAAILSVANNISVKEFTDRYYNNDASSGLILTTKDPHFDNDSAKRAQERWNEECGGKHNAFGTKFLGMGLEPHAIGGTLDAQAQQIIQGMSQEEIVMGIYRIPMDVFGPTQKSGGGVVIGSQSMEPAREMFIVNNIMPWAKFYDDEFNRDVTSRFPGAHKAQHDFTTNIVLESRRLDRAKAAAVLIDRGVSLNAVIKWLKLEIQPEPWGDEFWAPNWLLPASVIMKNAEDVYRGGLDDRQTQSQNEHIARIETMMQQTKTKEAARTDERDSLNGKDVGNRQRIEQIAGRLL